MEFSTIEEAAYFLIRQSEGYIANIYYDGKGIPTLGAGLALVDYDADKKEFKERKTVGNLTMDEFLNTILVELGVTEVDTVADEIKAALGADLKLLRQGGKPSSSYVALNLSEETFKRVVWKGSVNLYSSYLTEVHKVLPAGIWDNLSIPEQAAVYSLVYNTPKLVGPKLKNALSIYCNSDSASGKLVGKLSVWYEILYNTNGGGDRKGVQNRRFMEANAFLGNVHGMIYEGASKNNSVIQVSSFDEANVVIAFMKTYSQSMITYLSQIDGYNSRYTEIVQTNFSKAVEKIFGSRAYPEGFTLNKLFKEWNVLTDLSLQFDDDGRLNGEMKYETVAGTDKKDIIFLTATHDGATANGMNGDDVIYGAKDYTNIINAGQGSDTIYGGDKDDIVDGGMREDYGEDIVNHKDADQNIAYLYGGDDRYIGGLGDDTVYAGAGQDYVQPGLGVNYVDLGLAA